VEAVEPSGDVTLLGPGTAAAKEGDGSPVAVTTPTEGQSLPRLVDLGADKCVSCKMMAPILEELKEEYAGKMDVQFIDVWKNPDAGRKYGINLIPTQIFFDARGNERFRHEGFLGKDDILAKWKELGVDLGATKPPSFSRWKPAQPDQRPKDSVCYLCDEDINPKTRVVMASPAGDVAFCSPHCYVITFASLTDENKTHDGASVTDWSAGQLVPVTDAAYLYGMDANGRPTVQAFASEAATKSAQERSGGNVLAWAQFEAKETATRCGFCDRPVYPEDASAVRVDGMQSWGCCVMCALGVAARTGKNIEVRAKDALTGEAVHVKTYEGHVAELKPSTAVAWAGAQKDAEGKVSSTGCFKQAFFANEANLRKWVDAHPTATGQLVSIEKALAKKMKMTPQQISKACKIGECTPK
jgi:thioredoxin 1